jgi:hypothetical protein
LLTDAKFNVRLFAMPTSVPPADFAVKTYVTAYFHEPLDNDRYAALFPTTAIARFAKRSSARLHGAARIEELTERWLAKTIQKWQPDIVHTLGVDPCGDFFFSVRQRYNLDGPRWVLQTRGGSDLALTHLDPQRSEGLSNMMKGCDQLLSDNATSYQIARQLGIQETQIAQIGAVPGTGGIDIAALAKHWHGLPSSRNVIVVPKSYECPWSKMLPVYEAIKLCWEKIQPCEIYFFAMNPEAMSWYRLLPASIRDKCRAYERVPRPKVLETMTEARVMLAPSLVDGVPNSLYEAMAAGAFPIVSPIESIKSVVTEDRNVLFARNLYPDEIADRLQRAMTDDTLVDDAAQRNLKLVRQLANRDAIKRRVIEFYESLASNVQMRFAGV